MTPESNADAIAAKTQVREGDEGARRIDDPLSDMTAFQRDMMVVLAGISDSYGLAIKAELEAYYHEEVNHGRLYPNLDTLKDRGFVQKSERDKRTNDYKLTETGEQALLAHFEWEQAWASRGGIDSGGGENG